MKSIQAALLALIAAPAMAADLGLASTEFFIPLPETVLFDKTFKAISSVSTSPVNTLISVTVSTNGTVVYWDHWEDGYENPLVAAMQSTTEVWGDGNAANGCAPIPGRVCTNANDKLFAGQAIVIQNDVFVPRSLGATKVYDGGDNVKATYPVAITRGAYPDQPGSLLAGAVEVYDTSYGWGLDFYSPLGTNANLATNAFEYVAMYCQAKEDNTVIQFNGGASKVLKKGETAIYENILVNDRITSSKLVQVDIVTGDKGSTYEMRWYALLPRNMFSTSFVAPVGNTKGGVALIIYNPNSVSITATYKWLVSGVVQSASISVPARSNRVTNSIPTGSGAYVDSVGGDMIVMAVIDITDTGQLYDWGYPAQSREQLTPQVLIGLGYGCTDNVCDSNGVRSVVWITSVADADLYIDYNNDGTVDEKRSIKALASNLVWDTKDRDMSGAYIFATTPGSGATGTPVNIAAAWGQNPDFSFSGDNYALDLGTVVVPFPSLKVSKHIDLTVDANGDGIINAGDTVTYTIRVVNQSPRDIATGAFSVVDPVLNQMTYVAGSTKYSCACGSSLMSIADTAGGSFPLTGGLVSRCVLKSKGGEHAVSFQAKILGTASGQLTNSGVLKSSVCGDLPFEVTVPLVAPPTKAPTKAPTKTPTKTPTKAPTKSPTKSPTKIPTKSPTKTPTKKPTSKPTKAPTKAPTKGPTRAPTKAPTKGPTKAPTKAPTKSPTKKPTSKPTKSPTKAPTKAPTKKPTSKPTKSPTRAPTKAPTKSPTKEPTTAPTWPPILPVGPDGCYATFASGSMKTCANMLAGQYMAAGTVCAELINGANGDMVTITYNTTGTDYCLTETQAYFGDTIPCNGAGNPMIGNFPAKAAMSAGSCVKTFTIQTALEPACVAGAEYMNRIFKLAAHSSVQFANGSGGQTAWSVGKDIAAGGSWATYSETSVSCKCIQPTKAPTRAPTKPPTKAPTKKPTKSPTKSPTKVPTKSPTKSPTKKPTKVPTKSPTNSPTKGPTKKPTKAPTKGPTKAPSKSPTKSPTKKPTKSPTKTPTKGPTKSPTKAPTRGPTKAPTKGPTKVPTKAPTKGPTKKPTTTPTRAPTAPPTFEPIPGCPNASPRKVLVFDQEEL